MPYGLDSIHVSVGAGDSAIHLLVQHLPAGGKPVVKRACLIDGGIASAARQDLKPTIEDIYSKYDLPDHKSASPYMRFDSVVITHWDDDHYAGIRQLIWYDFDDQLQELIGSGKTVTEAYKELEKKQSRLFRYTGSGKDTGHLTTLYAPYWDETAKYIIHEGAPDPKKSRAEPDKPVQFEEVDGKFRFLFENTTNPGEKALINKLCNLCYKPEEMIAANFMDNTRIDGDYKAIKSVGALIDKIKGKGTGPVGVYCVSSKGHVIGSDKIFIRQLLRDPVDKGVHVFLSDYQGGEKKNILSVGAIVLWSEPTPKVTHYFGGDSWYKVEDAIANWLGTSVTNIKLSHHGAVTSTPIQFLDKVSPENIIISAGNKHAHPSWGTLLYLNAWLMAKKKSARSLYATCYPEYADLEIPGPKPNSSLRDLKYGYVDYFTGTDDKPVEWADFWKAMDALYASLDGISGLRAQARDWWKNLDEDYKKLDTNKKLWVIDQVQKAWEHNLSSMGRRETEGFVSHVRVRSLLDAADAVKDTVEVLYVNDPNNFKYSSAGKPGTSSPASRLATAITGGLKNLNANIGMDRIVKKKSPLVYAGTSRQTEQHYPMTPPTNNPGHGAPFQSDAAGDPARGEPPSGGSGGGGSLPDNPGHGGTSPHDPGASAADGYWMGSVPEPGVELISDERLRAFIVGLHYGKFGVVKKPTADSQTPFIDKEQWNCWFGDVLSTSSAMLLTVDAEAKPSGFLFRMKLPGGSVLVFNTHAVSKALDLDPSTAPKIGLSTTGTMIFGLQEEPPSGQARRDVTQSKLSEMLAYIKMERMLDTPLVQLLGRDMTLTLSVGGGSRNAIWFQPAFGYRVTQRLQWAFDAASLNRALNEYGVKIELRDSVIVTTRDTIWRPGPVMLSSGRLSLQAAVQNSDPSLSLICSIGFGEDGFTIGISAINSVWDVFVKWLGSALAGVDLGPVASALKEIDLIGKTLIPRRLSVSLGRAGGKIAVRDWSVHVETSIKSVPILLSYWGGNRRLQGRIWLTSDEEKRLLLPTWEKSDLLQPLTENPKRSLKLSDIGDINEDNIPSGVPNTITSAAVSINLSTKVIELSTTLACDPPAPGQDIPPLSLDTVDLQVSYSNKDKLSVSLFVSAALGQGDQLGSSASDESVSQGETETNDETADDGGDRARINGLIEYDGRNESWRLRAEIRALNFGSLYQLLDPSAQDDVAAVLGRFEVGRLDLEYQYGKKGKGTSFKLSGALLLGPLALSMQYMYNASGWSLKADLGSKDLPRDLTLGDIIDDLTDNYGSDAEELPSFICKLPITKGSGDSIISLSCVRLSKKDGEVATAMADRGETYILFQATVSLGSIQIRFAHYRDLSVRSKDPPKRVFKISMGHIPPVAIATLGELPQPFDEIAYVWVQDKKAQQQKRSAAGLTEEEVGRINRGIPGADQPTEEFLLYRDTRKPGLKKPTDVVVPAGSHFLVVMSSANTRRAILDYTFGREKKKKDADEVYQRAEPGGGGKKGNSAMAACKKVAGAISISNIGLRFKNNTLSVLLDASFLLGPIGFTFIEAALNIDLSKKTIREISLDDISFGLSGLAIAFDQPPVRLGGVFVHRRADDIEYYAGGIVIGLEPYQLVASGMYGKVKKPTEFETAFVFAKLEGPLITLEFAEISGITGGFGYNNEIKPPSIDTVREFPFIRKKDAGGSLLDYLGELVTVDGKGFFTVRSGAMWLAAGLKVSALSMLDIDAVFVVSWGAQLAMGIYGVAVANIPDTKGSRTFAHVELGILASVDFGAGVFKVEMQLAPSSYIFDPSCRLTGGFALYYWFNDSVPERSGEWVMTIGGYHRAFKRPGYYPNPPRLGIYWRVGSTISIEGEAYFAVTPKSCMAGGRLAATLSAGPLRAWFSAWADFLINYMPFDFVGQVGVSIGVSCKVDLLITSFTVSIEVGASLDLMGPPLRGVVKVDLWVVSFSIKFGPGAKAGDPPSLDGLYEMVIQSGRPESIVESVLAAAAPASRGGKTKKPHVFTCRGGMVNDGRQASKDPPEERPAWAVKANEFAFAIDVVFALTYAKVKRPKEFGEDPNVPEWESEPQPPLYAKPMEMGKSLYSELIVDIVPIKSKLEAYQDRLSDKKWNITEIIKEVPSALWGKYDPSEDPRRTKKNDIKSLLSGSKGTLPKLMGLVIKPPKPNLALDRIGKFDAIQAMQLAVFTDAETPKFAGFDAGDPGLLPGGKTSYDEVRKIWRETPETPRQDILGLLAKGLGWKSAGMTAATPRRTVSGLGSLYMACPQISVQ
ncbi:putative transcriptional activator srcap-like protein [Rosellinia necatrix]|uniref:Putative transcriptional activator srcap-like protein n=1 Tax=Rosellinia necatrix TaxID=77044 RepID=A0A1W2TBN0_ROSNE|nr:putative transcriptional activator srcap-like protein [Rosellinia necatrix]